MHMYICPPSVAVALVDENMRLGVDLLAIIYIYIYIRIHIYIYIHRETTNVHSRCTGRLFGGSRTKSWAFKGQAHKGPARP